MMFHIVVGGDYIDVNHTMITLYYNSDDAGPFQSDFV